jgi:hypothetical protein
MGSCHLELASVAHVVGKKAEAQEHLRQAKAYSAKAGNPYLAEQVEDLEREMGG